MDMISAICVTHASRFGLLQRSLISFLKQTYEPREMIIITSDGGYADSIRAFLADPRLTEMFGGKLPNVRIRVIQLNFRQLTEPLLHAAVWAEGNMFACWDDDDMSHPERLAYQREHTPPNRATMFSETLYHFYDSEELFVANFAQPGGGVTIRCAASSVMFPRNLFPGLDMFMRDTWASHVVSRIGARNGHDFLTGRPDLFMVGSNGDNFRGASLHRKLGSELPATWTRDQILAEQETVNGWLKAYSFPGGRVDVCGRDAVACAIDELSSWPSWLSGVCPPENWRARIPNRSLQERLQAERTEQRQRQH